jgi:hypothetical protein
MLTGFWRGTSPHTPPGFLVLPVWAMTPAICQDRPLILQLQVTLDTVTRWPEYVRECRAAVERAGLWAQVFAVQLGEEVYSYILNGVFDAVVGGMAPDAKQRALCAWFQDSGLPTVSRETGKWTSLVETTWDARWLLPRGVDLLGIDPYAPVAHRAAHEARAFDQYVARPLRAAAGYGLPVHVVGQAFADPRDPAWAAMPSASWLAMTRAYVGTLPHVAALSWFCWDTDPAGVVGLSSQSSAHRDALGVSS